MKYQDKLFGGHDGVEQGIKVPKWSETRYSESGTCPEWPMRVRSGAMQRIVELTCGMTFRQRWLGVGFPLRKAVTPSVLLLLELSPVSK